MGTLVVMRYPTSLFANLADHTYVECGTGGKAWACWGGKSGGTALRRNAGSTKRADAIAAPNERAGIKCYLTKVLSGPELERFLGVPEGARPALPIDMDELKQKR